MKIRAFCIVLLFLACLVVLFPFFCQAGQPTIPGFYGTIKWDARTMKSVMDQAQFRSVIQGAQNPVYSNNRVDINQTQEKAILEWNTFNVPPEVSVNFIQAASSWVALNRIYDANPSYIFGSINALGKVYLINQNGILFGPGSKVDVHTLVASALNITNSNFLSTLYIAGTNRYEPFAFDDYQGTGRNFLATVSNQGEINASDGGSVFLMAPRVDNSGVINTPAGQVGLIAGTDVTLMHSGVDDTSRSGYYIINTTNFSNPLSNDPTFGKAVNLEGGSLTADGGIVGMYGNNVEQLGTIRSITAFRNKRGMVELRAANNVTTGANSVISLPVDTSIDPATGKLATVDDSFDIQPQVYIEGLQGLSNTGSVLSSPAKQIEHQGVIQAPAGVVTMNAVDRIYLETGSRIDVSGVNAELPADILSAKLNSLELRDAYGQKGGVLQGATVISSAIAGSAVGDLSKIILTQDRTALERSIGGARRTIVDQATGTITYNNPQTGAINLTSSGDLIVKQGAVIDFSGGSAHYAGGFYDATKLLSGTKIYDIASAPLYLNYDRIMDNFTKGYERFGIKETYTGMYYGGASPLKSYVGSYTVGGDAGSLNLSAARIVLDGVLNGNVTKGTYQNSWTMKGSYSSDSDYDLAMALSVRRGLETPRPGALSIDTSGITDGQGRESSIEVRSETAPREIQADAPLQTGTTVLSASILNAAGLGTLNLFANLAVSTGEDATIRLQPGGSFSATARRIDHQGKITVPGGAINIIIGQNLTSQKDAAGSDNPTGYIINMQEKEEIVLGKSSLLDVVGEKIDNSMRAGRSIDALRFGHTTGGSISIKDKTDAGAGVSIRSGAVVDVSGGYTIDQKGKVTGGSAGLLDIQGSNIVLDGDLRGYALSDANGKLLGGSVTLRSTNIRVAPEAYIIPGTFVLAGNRFEDTGFTQIALYSINDTVIEPNTAIEPSLVRMSNPTPGRPAGSATSAQVVPAVGYAVPGRADIMRLNDDMAFMAGPSSITALAGYSFEGANRGFTGNLKAVSTDSEAKVMISPGAVVRTNPAVAGVTRIANDVGLGPSAVKTGITIAGRNVEVRGVLESLGGQTSISASSSYPAIGNLLVSQQAQIRAGGYNRPDLDSTPKNYPINYLPVAGGNVVLSATGDLVLAEGSLIDISGSGAVENRLRMTNGRIYAYREAGDPGSLSLSFGKSLQESGIIRVKNSGVSIPGIRGGTLILSKTENAAALSKSLDIGTGEGQVDLRRYISAGFDDITLKGYSSIQFNGAIEPAAGQVGRKLTLDAPVVRGTGQDVNLSAPWVVMTNSTAPGSPGDITVGGLMISGDWIDIIGSANISGFRDVKLQAKRDMRLSEARYINEQKSGSLSTKGNLTLDADRIYPSGFYSYVDKDPNDYTGTYSDFTIIADGKVTIQRSAGHTGGPIYSAGGSLTIEGKEGIEVKQGGYLAAPLGTITLSAPGNRIYLANGSVLSTAATNDTAVKYGFIDEGNLWMKVADKVSLDKATPVGSDSLPDKGISLEADTVIVRRGAEIDVTGGGSVFAYKFQPGTAGSQDPLTKTNRYLAFKDNSYQLPGSQVYLQGGSGLSEGLYTLLPLNSTNAKYAFMPGAYIIEAQKNATLPVSGKTAFTKDGYPLTIGYQAVADTAIQSTRPQVYSVRKASDVLKMEGDYVQPSLTAGNAGNIGITGATTILEGTLKGAALEGYYGGAVSLSAANVIVRQTAGYLLPENFDFNSVVGTDLQNKLILSVGGISGMGFREVRLGDKGSTSTVTIESGLPDTPTVLNVSIISVAAKDKIDIQTNAQLNALTGKDKDSGEGVINLTTPGTLTVGAGALVHAAHGINLDVNDVTGIQGNIQTDSSNITLKSEAIFFFDRGTSTAKGLYVTNDVWQRFSGFEDITFAGRDIQFKGATALSTASSLTLDAARILDMKTDGASTVSLTAPTVNIKNSSAAASQTTAPAKADANKGVFTVNASGQINIGGGDVQFDGFKTINLFSGNDLSVKGIGSLATGNTVNGFADLNITAARVVTGSDSSSTKKYIAPNFTINAGTAAIKMTGVPGISPAVSPAPGGLLEIMARRIELATVLQSDGGTIRLTTRGSTGKNDDGVF
ncbi:MAG TPA: filamentous hemagglutinin N-terminal domain-containing protein, partial [Syntrophales bacterium]|nr:filamentous hemagglutinin N-terminal domain-containing protein [Syntrophales bacterium]